MTHADRDRSERPVDPVPFIARAVNAAIDYQWTQDATLKRFRSPQEATVATPAPQDDTPDPHEHRWTRHQNVTSRGYHMPPYYACECGAATSTDATEQAAGSTDTSEAQNARLWSLVYTAEAMHRTTVSVAELRAALDVPAGPPLHEPTDRDGERFACTYCGRETKNPLGVCGACHSEPVEDAEGFVTWNGIGRGVWNSADREDVR